MTDLNKDRSPAVSSEAYTREYFEHWCQGADDFRKSKGEEISRRLKIPFELANVESYHQVLDIGSGRGELALHCAQQGALVWSVDYAVAAIELSQEALIQAKAHLRGRIKLVQADARVLPLADESVDIAFMLDIVEHLEAEELNKALQEVHRVLRVGGQLVIHTMPNLWYYTLGYPLYRVFQRLRGLNLPRDPRDRWPFKEVHINEQTPLSLARVLRASGLQSQVFLKNTQLYEFQKNRFVRWGMRALASLPVVKWIFCNDIFAIATKVRNI
jgi:SAM-dependent methyltransferase